MDLISSKSKPWEWDLIPQAMTRDSIMYTTNQTNHVHYMSYTPSPFVAPLLLMTSFYHILLVPGLVCRNICERIYSKKILFGKSNYCVGKKYCRRCEVYMYYNEGMFCPCCGMQLRLTPSNREGKDRLRQERRIAKIRNEHN
ncbi:MAG: hypothetical protein ACJ71P_19360 [Nitrososphaeraceae archaeon]